MYTTLRIYDARLADETVEAIYVSFQRTDTHTRGGLMTTATGNSETNRKILLDFIELFYHQRKVRLAFERHVAEDYIQHNPNIRDGREAAITALEPLFSSSESSFHIQRILVDGDFAAIHLHGRRSPQALGGAVVDLYRFAAGKIVEHWDVLQPIPETAINPHPMF